MPGFILQASRRSGVQGSGTQGSGAQASPLEADTAPCRIGFTATKKVGNAVVRNRTKRRLRAAADALLPQYGRAGFDYVLVGRMTTQERKFDALCNDLQNALMRIHQEQKTVNKNR